MQTLNQALSLAGRGWYVFPCRADKQPSTRHGFKDATCDPAAVRKLFTDYPGELIGIACEKSGFFAVDIDRHEGKPDGLRSWSELVERYGESKTVECGPMQMTPSGGYHALFQLPESVKVPNNAGKLAPGLDLRSTGYICTGEGYQWLEGHGPDTTLIDAPTWLLDRIQVMTQRSEPEPSRSTARESVSAAEYWYNHFLPLASDGNRNDTLYRMGLQLNWSDVSESEATNLARSFASVKGLPEKEALATMRSAYAAPKRQPAILPFLNGHHATQRHAQPPEPEAPPTMTTEQPPAPEQGKQKVDKPTDDELAMRFIDRYPLTAYGMGEWRRYNAGVWAVVPEARIAKEVIGILQEAKFEGIRPTRNLIASVMGIAQYQLTVDDEVWDSCHDVIVCKNGAFHIPSMTLQKHSPEHYATSRLDFDYDPQAGAPHWGYVLLSTIPDAVEFLQEYAGLALTTETQHEMALWFYGPAGSGKSTIIEGLQAMLGERSTLLGLADIERSRFSLGNLRGKTLAVASEQPALYMQTTHILNAIVSGEKIHTERKFKDPIEFMPRVKIVWAMNELPRVPDAGNGLFRRVRVIKFPALAENDRDPRLKEEIKKEGAGILNWAIEGLHRLRERGRFEIPACVNDATADFQKNNDIPAVFVADRCLIGSDYKIQAQALYDAYRQWCENNGHKWMSSTTVATEWERLGFTKYRSAGRSFWQGVDLKLED